MLARLAELRPPARDPPVSLARKPVPLHLLSIKRKHNYDKARREARAGSRLRCEDPLEPPWVHRPGLSFLYTDDASMSADAANLAHVDKEETLAYTRLAMRRPSWSGGTIWLS